MKVFILDKRAGTKHGLEQYENSGVEVGVNSDLYKKSPVFQAYVINGPQSSVWAREIGRRWVVVSRDLLAEMLDAES